VRAIANEPNGMNINVGCGATDLMLLQETVRTAGVDLGVAFDGDGDRMLAVDARGEVVDGDQILAVLALAMRERSALRAGTVVATVMSNLGFKLALEREGPGRGPDRMGGGADAAGVERGDSLAERAGHHPGERRRPDESHPSAWPLYELYP
jgi:hypothetical protein